MTNFAALDHHMEFKFHPGDDPFRDFNASFTCEEGKYERNTYASSDSRGQIMSYVSAQVAIQFRTHFFRGQGEDRWEGDRGRRGGSEG